MPKTAEREAPLQELEIPDELPIIPLVSTIVFPNIVVNLQVVRKRNLHLVRDLQPEGIVGLVIQRGSGLEFPPVEDLTPIGVAARLVTRINVSRNTVQIILLGLARFHVNEYVQTDPYLRARVTVLEEPDVESMEANVLMGNAIHLLETLVRQDNRLSEEILHLIRNNLTGPGNLADQIANHLSFKLEEKKEILMTIPPLERLQVAIRLLKKALDQIKVGQEIQEATQEEITKSQREYYLREQLKMIKKELGEGNESETVVADLRKKLSEGKYPEAVVKEASREMDRLTMISPASAEYSVVKTYVDWLLELPWSIHTTDNLDIAAARKVLERDHYGLEKIKDRILEYLAVRKLKSDMKGPILCFYGPPGTGKTSLGKSIAEALGRKFIRMSVGGMRDEAEIRGHRRTYVGALPGKIIQSLRRAGTANPMMMIDEIDKIGSDFRGDPASALLEVLDPEQNSGFLDLYLDIPFDLSRVMFITTANRLDTVPDPLRDRMEILHLPGYIEEEKLAIARQYLIPKQVDAHGLRPDQLAFDRKAIVEIIRGHTSEAGLRRLEQLIGQVCRKVAKSVALGQPARRKIGPGELQEFLGPAPYLPEVAERRDEVGVATGLAWTAAGGDILFIEATRMKGRGVFNLTGHLGDVMKESAQAALSFVRTHAADLGIPERTFEKSDIHVHVPAGAIPKDGPSAGVTMATAIASLLSDRRTRHDVAMTGEITLRGKVLPVGGVKEKVLAARRAGIRTVILPARNEKDLLDIPAEARKQMRFIFVREVEEVLKEALRATRAEGEASRGRGGKRPVRRARPRKTPPGRSRASEAAAKNR